MTNTQIAQKRLSDQALKERMVDESSSILETVDYLQDLIEAKLLEIDGLPDDYTCERASKMDKQVRQLLSKLEVEKRHMDDFMVKYRRLVNEKETLLPSPRQEKPVYLRGVPTNQKRTRESKTLPTKTKTKS